MLWHNKTLILFPGGMRTKREGPDRREETTDCWQSIYMKKISNREEIDFIRGLFVYNNMTDILIGEDIFGRFCGVNNHNFRGGKQSELDSKI